MDSWSSKYKFIFVHINFTNIKHLNFSTARLESVSGVGHWWERHSTAYTEGCSGKHGIG